MEPITVSTLVTALRNLRERTNDKTYSHTVKQGKFQLCRVVYGKGGRSTVTPLSEYQDASAHLALMQSITR